jgi:excisionase family DNA binding protein
MESTIARMLSVQEVQKLLNVSKDTVYKLTHTEGFPKIRIGKRVLIPEQELGAWIKAHIETEKTEVKES